MSLLYVAAPRTNPTNPLAPKKYYLQSKIRGHKSYRSILNTAAKNITANPKEIDLAVNAWLDAMFSALEDGFSVEMEGFGTFSTSIKSEGVATEEEATPAKLKNISMSFRVKPEVRQKVNNFKLEKYIPGGTL